MMKTGRSAPYGHLCGLGEASPLDPEMPALHSCVEMSPQSDFRSEEETG